MMEYKVITSGQTTPEKASEQLSQRVTSLLLDGWELVGGVSLTFEGGTSGRSPFYTICQALKKAT